VDWRMWDAFSWMCVSSMMFVFSVWFAITLSIDKSPNLSHFFLPPICWSNIVASHTNWHACLTTRHWRG
jgi:hypothetical protein